MPTQPERPATPQTRDIIGRRKELEAIREAIEGTGSCVLHFLGVSGIGKTRQLREVARWYDEQGKGQPLVQCSFEWLGIVDLYHSDLHTPSLIEREIIQKIDPNFETNPEQSPFKTYLEERATFEERRRQGLVSAEAEAELTQAFVSNYNKWANDRRAVIAFDTLELIVYEEDKVLKVCEGETTSADVKGWLLEVLPSLRNTVVLLASRLHPQLEAELASRFDSAEVCYERFDLITLSKEGTRAYLEDIFVQRPDIREALEEPDREAPDIYPEIWQYTEGVPILISLMIDLVAFGEVAAFAKLRDIQAPRSLLEVKKLLVDELQKVKPPIWDTLGCLAVARKGLTPELFNHMMTGWSPNDCRRELDRLREATFIKTREGTDALFLHDALYEMLDELDPYPMVDPGRLLPEIIDYYEKQIQACEADMSECRTGLRELDLRERAGLGTPKLLVKRRELQEQLAALEREWQRLQVEVVYYELWHDTRTGFERYARLNGEALEVRRFGFDARLHDEVLRYFQSRQYTDNDRAKKQLPQDEFERHCGVRWVKHHWARGGPEGNKRAARVAERILNVAEPPLGGAAAQADSLYIAEVRLWGAESLIYLGQGREAVNGLETGLDILTSFTPRRPYEQRRLDRLTGRVHNNLGYLAWQQMKYKQSVAEYRRALPYLRRSDILVEVANTLNNLAYSYSALGETDRAKALIEDAQHIREKLGQSYALALSFNTRGEIHTTAGDPEEAVVWCERARTVFATIINDRGLGLAYIGLGRAHRKIGDKGKRGQYPFEQTQGAFEQAVEWLQSAHKIFGGDAPRVNEPYRQWETLNELGSTYVDWAYLLVHHGLPEQADEKYRLSVHYQEQAAQVAKDARLTLQMLDSHDDLAQVYADWGQLDQAQGYLDRAKEHRDRAQKYLDGIYQAVPQEYQLVEGMGFQELTDPVDSYWLLLGKYHLQRGIWTHYQAELSETPQEKDEFLNETARHFALAMAYFQQFSPALALVNLTSRAMYRRFRTLSLERLERLRDRVEQVAQEYRLDLDRLIDTLDDTLGFRP